MMGTLTDSSLAAYQLPFPFFSHVSGIHRWDILGVLELSHSIESCLLGLRLSPRGASSWRAFLELAPSILSLKHP